MADSKTGVLVVVGLLVGVVAGYGVGFVVYHTQITQLQSDLSDTETALSASQSEVETLQSQLSDAETQITNLTSNLAEARATIADHEVQISNLESDLADATETISDLEEQVSDLESDISYLLSRITPESGYETILMYGLSLEYPEYMDMSVGGVLSASGADEHSGILVAQKPDETEIVIAIWTDSTYPRDLDDALDTNIAGTQGVTSTGERVTSIINGHTIKYQSFTAVIEGKTYNAVISYWNCDSTQRVYGLEYLTIEEDAISGFMRILDSFICH